MQATILPGPGWAPGTNQVEPLPASAGVNFLVVASTGLLTIALDHVVLTARMPLLAGIALAIVVVLNIIFA